MDVADRKFLKALVTAAFMGGYGLSAGKKTGKSVISITQTQHPSTACVPITHTVPVLVPAFRAEPSVFLLSNVFYCWITAKV